MCVYISPGLSSPDCPPASTARLRSWREPGARYPSMPMIGLTPWARALRQNS